jgi:hypothetical protein
MGSGAPANSVGRFEIVNRCPGEREVAHQERHLNQFVVIMGGGSQRHPQRRAERPTEQLAVQETPRSRHPRNDPIEIGRHALVLIGRETRPAAGVIAARPLECVANALE